MSSNPQDNPLLNQLVTFIQHDVPDCKPANLS